MNIIISEKEVQTNALKPFTPTFNQVFISVDEDFEDNNFKLTEKNIKKLFDVINFSWDGEIYWFSSNDKEKVLSELTSWFKDEQNHPDFEDGIGNCFLIKQTPNGMAIIDTQLDMTSNINSFLSVLESKHPDISFRCYSDSHLIDNLDISRDSMEDGFGELYFLYKENVIDNSFFFNGLRNIDLVDPEDQYYNMLPQNQEIVITGKFPVSREELTSMLDELGFTVSENVGSNSWLWTGEKVGKEKISKAQEKGAQVSTMDEIIDLAYINYVSNKNASKSKLKP